MTAALATSVKEDIIASAAAGAGSTELARKHGCAIETVSRLKSANKDRIIELASRIMERSSEAVFQNHIKTLELANGVLNKDPQAIADMATMGLQAKDLLTISDKKEYRTLLMMGIVPGGAPGPIIQNIFGDISLNLVDANVRSLLGSQLDRLEDDTLDAEVIE